MKRVRVAVDAPYDVLIGEGVFAELAGEKRRLAVVVDENVARLHAARLDAVLGAVRCERFVLPSGEKHKTLETASRLYDWLAQHRFERSEPVVAIGGGVCGDLSGFVAATWRRGMPFIQVPTTLLADVDASVGGKVAVDHPAGKNLIGAFHQPERVLIDIAFLETLPEREHRSGMAEVVKTALLAGDALTSRISQQKREVMTELIAVCVEYKASVVERDPHERGERAVLNLGHTVGHALEKLGGFEELLHGEAVAHGLLAALELSNVPKSSPAWALVRALKPPAIPAFDLDEVMDAMRSDKKVVSGQLKFVLLDDIGRPRWGCDVAESRVREVVRALLKGEL